MTDAKTVQLPDAAVSALYGAIFPGSGRIETDEKILAAQAGIQPAEVGHVLDFIFAEAGRPASVDAVRGKFSIEIIQEYKDHVLLCFKYKPTYGAEWRSRELWSLRDYKAVDLNAIIDLGSISGKHSENCVRLDDIIDEIYREPADILEQMADDSYDEYSSIFDGIPEENFDYEGDDAD